MLYFNSTNGYLFNMKYTINIYINYTFNKLLITDNKIFTTQIKPKYLYI